MQLALRLMLIHMHLYCAVNTQTHSTATQQPNSDAQAAVEDLCLALERLDAISDQRAQNSQSGVLTERLLSALKQTL
jgi:hypothetical protein